MMKNHSKQNNVIQVLTTAALALPGIQEAQAAAPINGTKAEFGYTYYDEGKDDFYEVDVYQARIQTGLNDKWQLDVYLGRENQTGGSIYLIRSPAFRFIGAASPFPTYALEIGRFNETAAGTPVDNILSAASIVEDREFAEVTASYFFPESVLEITGGYSTEHDYQSKSLGVQWNKPFNKKSTELSLGASYTSDYVEPVEFYNAYALPRDRATSRGHRQMYKLSIGLRQDLTPNSTIQGVLGYKRDQGYLADPYKLVMIYGDARSREPTPPNSVFYLTDGSLGAVGLFPAGLSIDRDRRPNSRDQWTFLVRGIHHIDKTDSSLHLSYRYADISWKYHSHMFEFSWFQPLPNGWEIVPTVRHYSQTEAWFYGPVFYMTSGSPFPAKPVPADVGTSDYRLGIYGVLSGEIQVSKELWKIFKLSLVAGVNDRKEHYYWGSRRPFYSHPYNNHTARYYGVYFSTDFSSDNHESA